MGLFKKKNKPVTTEEMDKMFGEKINKVEDREMSRKENRNLRKAQYDIEKQKHAILTKLHSAYNKISQTEYYEEAERVLDLMDVIKTGSVDNNERAVYAIDGFILNYIEQLILYCNQKNLYGISTAIDEISHYANQRSKVTYKYYEDAKYLKTKLATMDAKVNRENINNQIRLKIESFSKLKEDALQKSKAQQEVIGKQMLQIKAEKDELQKKQDALDIQIANFTTLIAKIETNSETYLSDEVLDQFGEVLEDTMTQDAKQQQATKLAEKLNGSNKTVRNKGLEVSDVSAVDSQSGGIDIQNMEI